MIDGRKVLLTLYTKNHPQAELAAAKEQGYLIEDPDPISHDETLAQLRLMVEKTDPWDAANAFLYSLSTRKPEYRSALGSYWYARSIPGHTHGENAHCYLCGWTPLQRSYYDGYTVFNHERHKWGGVRHTDPNYCLFDLQQFQKLPKVTPSQEDWRILKAILDTVSELEPQKKAGALRQLLTRKKLFRSNSDELDVLLGILGICGILASPDAPSYCDRFVDEYSRAPVEHTNDLYYPLNRWQAADGVNENRFLRVFGRQFRDC